MLTLIALSALLMQDPPTPPAPPAPPAPPEVHARFLVVGDGPGGLDKDGDGQITREEFAAPMNDHFARMDKDGDGRLSTEELSAGHGPGAHVFMRGPGGEGGPGVRHFELSRSGAPGEHAEHDVRTMVFAGRGEGGAHGEHEIVIRGPGDEGGPRIIHLPRGAGGEHNVMVRRLGGPDGEHKMDADNDGRISEAEFTGPLREAFTRMDADRSGFLEEGERGQGHDVQVFSHRIETRQDRED
ncbi:EF-hand domain-containing protein [Brevundimonas sp.]|uniref:EF-hand domain-containing protein n=1 Tax=Brevundimonas sp. TaxID=1871086 RepID=UPI002FC93692